MKILFLITTLLLLTSCIKNNETPAWLKIDKWQLNPNPELSGQEGELSLNITNAWVYVNDELIGVFQVPCKIPVLKSGNVNIKVYPTILNNGISATKKIYPFLNVYEINTILAQGQIKEIQPITSYKNNLSFWIEDFEDANSKIINDDNSASELTFGNTDSLLKWGNYYGEITLNTVDSTWIGYTNSHLELPKGQEVYMEIDYFNTNSLTTGLISVSSNGITNNVNIKLNKQSLNNIKWKKIYIDLKELVSYGTTSDYFELSFLSKLEPELESSIILIDNIKIIHF